jgi:hypothetical protein
VLFKLLASVVIAFVVILVAGLSGFSFRVWPTGFNDHHLTVTPEVLQRLRDVQAEHKFGPDNTTFYPGALSEAQRLRAQQAVDHPGSDCRVARTSAALDSVTGNERNFSQL